MAGILGNEVSRDYTAPYVPITSLTPGTTAGDVLYWDGTAWESKADGVFGTGTTIVNQIVRWGDTTHTSVKSSPILLTSNGEFTDTVGNRFIYNNAVSHNVLLGYGALAAIALGTGNTGLGENALALNSSGSNNTAVGYGAGAAISTGSTNTIIGRNAAPTLTTGSDNVVIGNGADVSLSNTSAQLVIGNATLEAAICLVDAVAITKSHTLYIKIGANVYKIDADQV